MSRLLRLMRCKAGVASFVALGVVLVTGALLIGYGLWVRYAVESATVFENRLRAQHAAREGVGVAIALLLEDEDPQVDWPGEAWARADELATTEATVRIHDEGSLLGLNWMDSTLWQALPGMTSERAEALTTEGRWIGSAGQLAALELEPEDVDAIVKVTTPYSPFNINTVDADRLHQLFVSFGESPTGARRMAQQIVEARVDQRLTSMDQLSRVVSALRSELRERVEGWLVFSGPINVNTASVEVLSYLAKVYEVADDRIGALVEARREAPLRTLSEVERLLEVKLVDDGGRLFPLARWLTFQSRFFRIVSETTAPAIQITAIVYRLWNDAASEWKVAIVSWKEETGP